MTPSDERIAVAILDLAQARGVDKTLCPSEVARQFGPDWRALMPDVRRVARRLAAEGRISVTQRGRVVDAEQARGAIRLRLSPGCSIRAFDGSDFG